MLNPILSFSAARRMRSFRTMLIAVAYTVVLLIIAVLMMGRMFAGEVLLTQMSSARNCYMLLLFVQFGLLLLIGPAMTSGAIAGERERQTLELLLVTNTRSFRIVAGKMMESFALLALLIVCGLPVMMLPVAAGGVTVLQVLAGELFLLAMAFATVCVGVLASALCRSTVLSAVAGYLILLLIGLVTAVPLLFGYPQRITDVVYDSKLYAQLTPAGALGMIHPLLLLNPGYALVALLHGQTRILVSAMEYRGWGRLLCTYLLMDRAGGQTVALISSGAITALGFGLMSLSALLVRPGKKKRKKK